MTEQANDIRIIGMPLDMLTADPWVECKLDQDEQDHLVRSVREEEAVPRPVFIHKDAAGERKVVLGCDLLEVARQAELKNISCVVVRPDKPSVLQAALTRAREDADSEVHDENIIECMCDSLGMDEEDLAEIVDDSPFDSQEETSIDESAAPEDDGAEDSDHREAEIDDPARRTLSSKTSHAVGSTDAPYQIMPDLSDDEYRALEVSIREEGVKVPVEYDADGNILDGHHRIQICEELGIDDFPTKTRSELSEEEKVEHILSLNLDRRHLDKEQRREVVMRLRQDGWSLRRIGEKLGIGKSTVERDIKERGVPNGTGEPGTVQGVDGKTYPATQPVKKESSKGSHGQEEDQTACGDDTGQDVTQNGGDAPGMPEPPVTADEEHESAGRDKPAAADGPAPANPSEHIDGSEDQGPSQSEVVADTHRPEGLVQAAEELMGGIDVTAVADGISSADAQPANGEDVLQTGWNGRVFMMPPPQRDISAWVEKVHAAYTADAVTQAILVVPSQTHLGWFDALHEFPRCFVLGEVIGPGDEGCMTSPVTVFYMGERVEAFTSAFERFGRVYPPAYPMDSDASMPSAVPDVSPTQAASLTDSIHA